MRRLRASVRDVEVQAVGDVHARFTAGVEDSTIHVEEKLPASKTRFVFCADVQRHAIAAAAAHEEVG